MENLSGAAARTGNAKKIKGIKYYKKEIGSTLKKYDASNKEIRQY